MKHFLKLIEKIEYWFNKKTNQYYWYEVRYIYSENGTTKFNFVKQIGVREMSNILDKRGIKKIEPPLHLKNEIRKSYLNNGFLDIEIICYLGKFKNND